MRWVRRFWRWWEEMGAKRYPDATDDILYRGGAGETLDSIAPHSEDNDSVGRHHIFQQDFIGSEGLAHLDAANSVAPEERGDLRVTFAEPYQQLLVTTAGFAEFAARSVTDWTSAASGRRSSRPST